MFAAAPILDQAKAADQVFKDFLRLPQVHDLFLEVSVPFYRALRTDTTLTYLDLFGARMTFREDQFVVICRCGTGTDYLVSYTHSFRFKV